MLPIFQRREPGNGGEYSAVPDDEKDSKTLEPQKPRVPLLWLYISLSMLWGFIVAIALVNLYPEHLIIADKTGVEFVGPNAQMQKLLSLPTEQLDFEPIASFQGQPTKKSDEEWQSLLGPSLGLVQLNNSAYYGLPPGANGGTVYQLSLAHQVQCLHLIRKVYWGNNQGIYNVSATPPSSFIIKTNHCFDYLIQSIKCSADLTMESKLDESGNFVGWGTPHRCTSWEAVTEFMEKYKYGEAEKAVDHHHHGDHDEDEDED